jgi:hypothetical protein
MHGKQESLTVLIILYIVCYDLYYFGDTRVGKDLKAFLDNVITILIFYQN